MGSVLAISSQVARGYVGLSAIVPALQRLGHEVIAAPTVVLSNHPGHGHAEGTAIGADVLKRMLDALAGSGWLSGVEACLIGYLPSMAHVAVAREAIGLVRGCAKNPVIVCDPILGDDPKGLYVEQAVAHAIREKLVPAADLVTPNRFELAWLSGREVSSAGDALEAARALPPRAVLATSIPAPSSRYGNLYVGADRADLCAVAVRARVPHGTGDFLSSLFLAHLLRGHAPREALARSVAGAAVVVEASTGRDELALVATQALWAHATPLPVEPL